MIVMLLICRGIEVAGNRIACAGVESGRLWELCTILDYSNVLRKSSPIRISFSRVNLSWSTEYILTTEVGNLKHRGESALFRQIM
jgi:hypothetical protein